MHNKSVGNRNEVGVGKSQPGEWVGLKAIRQENVTRTNTAGRWVGKRGSELT